MAIKTIITEPNKILRQKSMPVNNVGKEERRLMDDMLDTMYKAPGIGLAAVQIGILKRIVVIDISKDENKKDPIYFINPELTWKSKEKELKIKFNNKIFHQSKLLNYFLNKTSLPKVEKEANDLLKKIKKNKKYSFSKKDIMMIESLKSDGVQILKKYDKLYDNKKNVPVEINSMIANGESGLLLLKIAHIIGEDELKDIDIESVSFIVGILNELRTINLRNEILLNILPLKV